MPFSATESHNTCNKLDTINKSSKRRRRPRHRSRRVKDVHCKKKCYESSSVHNKTQLKSNITNSSLGSVQNHSLMNKLITSGLAKNISLTNSDLNVEESLHVSVPDELKVLSNKNTLSVDSVPSLTLSNDVMCNKDEDDEIEVIIPPKKTFPVVTLDSDGDEVDANKADKLLSKVHASKQIESIETLSTNSDICEEVMNEIPNNMVEERFSDSSSVKCLGSEEEPEPYTPSSPSVCSIEEKERCPSVSSNIDVKPSENHPSSNSCNKTTDEENQAFHTEKQDFVLSTGIGEYIQANNGSKDNNCRHEDNSIKEHDCIECSFASNNKHSVDKSEVHLKMLSLQRNKDLPDSSQETDAENEPYSPSSFCGSDHGNKQTRLSYMEKLGSNNDFSIVNSYLKKLPIIESQVPQSVTSSCDSTTNSKNITDLKLEADKFDKELCASLIVNIDSKPIDCTREEIHHQSQIEQNPKVISSTETIQCEKPLLDPQPFSSNNNNNSEPESNLKIDESDDEDDLSQLRLIALSTKGKPNQSLTRKKEQMNTKEVISHSNTSADDDYDNEEEDILQLRVAALKSAVMKKHEERKKRGLKVKKRKRASSEDLFPLSTHENIISQYSPSQSKDLLSEVAVEPSTSNADNNDSLQGEEDMEIASDSGGDIQDGNIEEKHPSLNQPCNSWQSFNADATIKTCLPDNSVVSDIVLNNNSMLLPQPLPPGVDADFMSHSVNHTFSCVLPPPPPPPSTLVFSLALPPPPPPTPPLKVPLQQIDQFQKNNTDRSLVNFDQSVSSCNGKSYYEMVEDIVYDSQSPISNMNCNSVSCDTNDGTLRYSEVGEVHKVLQRKRNCNIDSNNFEKQMPNVTHNQLRPNLKAIPVLVNTPKKILTKKKLKKMQKKLKNKSKHLNQEPKLLCITNTPNFCKSRSKINLLAQSQKGSAVLCSTNIPTGGIIKQNSATTKVESVSLCDETMYAGASPVLEDDMDLSGMIVLDEVGMSPEPIEDTNLNCPLKNDEEDENTLRAQALTSLSTNAIPTREVCGVKSKGLSNTNSYATNCVEINDNSFRNYFKPRNKMHPTNTQKELENISVTRRVDVNDSSKYRLTRIVRTEPRRSVIQGRESLKVVIPSDSPPLMSHPSPPVVDRLVINIGQDSDSDDDSEWLRKVQIEEKEYLPPGPVVDHELERSIDLLLLNARKTTESCISVKNTKNQVAQKKRKHTSGDDITDTPLVSIMLFYKILYVFKEYYFMFGLYLSSY